MTLFGIALDQFLIVPIALVAFVFLLTIIVFIHEYGHFSVARALGVKIDVFSIGFGKTIASWVDKKGTEWRIAAIPLGGYVKFFGDANAASQARADVAEETEAHPATTQFPRPGHEDEIGRAMTPAEKRVCFHFKPVWARAAIVSAGPLANFVLAVAIFFCLFMAFGGYLVEPRIAKVLEDSAAAEAGFQPGDRIVAVNGRPLKDFDDLAMNMRLSAGEETRFTVERAGEIVTLVATPRRAESEDAFGNKVRAGVLGVQAEPGRFVRYGPVESLSKAVGRVGEILSASLRFLGRLILLKEDASQLGGPIKMAQYAGQAAMSGFDDSAYAQKPDFLTKLKVSLTTFINLAAVVSVSIGFLNLLPVPVLDGGHLMYYAYEAVAGKPLGTKAQAIGFKVGIVLLASLMLFVTWNDISNLPLFSS
ncbi:MAG: RIP metalloprotease [Amphiplicatus sp.]